MNDIRGKQVLITGAARGIGYAFARAFVDEGASVMIADRDIERAETAAQSLGERCAAVSKDAHVNGVAVNWGKGNGRLFHLVGEMFQKSCFSTH